MSIEVKDLGKSQISFEVKVEKDVFNSEADKAFKQNASKITLPGFRKGKAPRAMIEKMYGKGAFYDEAINNMLQGVYDHAISELDLDIVSRPEVDVKEVGEDIGVTFEFKVFVRPVIEAPEYKGITVKKVVYTVNDEEIEAELKRVAERNSRIVPVEDRAVENGDIANIDFEGFVDNVAFEGGKGEAFDLTIGSGQFIPGFEEQLIGNGTNDDVDVTVTFPEDYQAEELKGKEAIFKVKINKVTTKEIPEINDDLASDASEFDTLEEYKADIRAKLEEKASERTKAEFENEIVKQLADPIEIEIPDSMVSERMDGLAKNFESNLMQQGINREMYLKYVGMDEKAYLEQFRVNAISQVKSSLVIESIAIKENVSVTEEEYKAEIEKFVTNYGVKEEDVTKYVSEKEIRRDLSYGKTIDLLVESVVANEVSEEKEEK